MAASQEAFNMEKFTRHMKNILPEFSNGKYKGKRLKFPFAHPDTRVDFSRVQLEQELPGEVFEMSYPDCPMQCAEHEEELQSIVRDSCHQVNWAGGGNLLLRFGNILLRKKRFSNNLSAEEIVQTLAERPSDMKVNVRNLCIVKNNGKFPEIFKQVGAVMKSKRPFLNELRIPINNASFQICLSTSNMTLSKIIQAPLCGKQICMPFPVAPNTAAKIHGLSYGLIMQPIRQNTIEFDEVCGMCNDPTLLSILKTPGLGFLSKKQDPERFVIDESCVDWITCLFGVYQRFQYSYDLDGVQVVVESSFRVNYGFEYDRTESKVHQRTPGRVTSILFQRNEGLSVDKFVAIVTRVILALKNAIHDGKVPLAAFEVVQRMKERIINEILFNSPKWLLSQSQLTVECTTHALNVPLNQGHHSATAQKHAQSETSALAILRPIRDGQTLEEMLVRSPGVHAIVLRAAVRRLLEKIEELRHWSPTSLLAIGLDANGQDLTRLKQKLLDAAAERNLSL